MSETSFKYRTLVEKKINIVIKTFDTEIFLEHDYPERDEKSITTFSNNLDSVNFACNRKHITHLCITFFISRISIINNISVCNN